MVTGFRSRFRSIVATLALGTVESLISQLESIEDVLLDSSDPSDLAGSDLDDLDDLDDVDEEEEEEDLGVDLDDLESLLDDDLEIDSPAGDLLGGVSLPDDLPARPIFDERLCPIALVDSKTGSPVIVLESHKENFGASCRLKLPDEALSWATCQVVGIQVSVHEYVGGMQGPDADSKKVVAAGDIEIQRVYTNKTRSVHRRVDEIGEEGVAYTVVYSTARRVQEGAQGHSTLKTFERWAEGRVKSGARSVRGAKGLAGLFRRDASGIPLYGRNLRINEGPNLFVANGWNPLSEFTADKYATQMTADNIGHPGLRGYPTLLGTMTELDLELAMGPTGHDRAIPYYVSVSLVVRIKQDYAFSGTMPKSKPGWGSKVDSPSRADLFSRRGRFPRSRRG